MIKKKVSAKDFEVTLKSLYGLTFDTLPNVRDLNGLDVAPFVFAYLLTIHEKLRKK